MIATVVPVDNVVPLLMLVLLLLLLRLLLMLALPILVLIMTELVAATAGVTVEALPPRPAGVAAVMDVERSTAVDDDDDAAPCDDCE